MHYGPDHVLHGVSLKVSQGDIVTIGANDAVGLRAINARDQPCTHEQTALPHARRTVTRHRPDSGVDDFSEDRRDQQVVRYQHPSGGTEREPCARSFKLRLRVRDRTDHFA